MSFGQRLSDQLRQIALDMRGRQQRADHRARLRRIHSLHHEAVFFDPPHLVRAGKNSWLAARYGRLGKDWRQDLRAGFAECFRVLRPEGVLIFKSSEVQVATRAVLELTDRRPLFEHPSGKRSGTHWICFMK